MLVLNEWTIIKKEQGSIAVGYTGIAGQQRQRNNGLLARRWWERWQESIRNAFANVFPTKYETSWFKTPHNQYGGKEDVWYAIAGNQD